MAQIGYGYGSEWQLLRFLGHHRDALNYEITKQTGIKGDFHWLDFEFADRRKRISGDEELKGISFLKKIEFIDDILYQEIETEYKKYKIGNVDNWQNWDAILVVKKAIYLIEAKAHIKELSSRNKKHGGKSRESILQYMKEQLPIFPVSEEWMKDYYQLANRLATTALLNKHLNKLGIKVKTMGMYFVNGYEKRVAVGNKLCKITNKDASKEDFVNAIAKEIETLNLKDFVLDDLLTEPVFIDCNKA
jgi:hypothetical protein